MTHIVIVAFLLNVLGLSANAHPLFDSEHGIEISGQTLFGDNGQSGSEAVHVFDQDDELLAEGPIPFSSPDSTTHLNRKEEVNENESISTYPSWFTSTLLARRLLALSTTGVFSTVFPEKEDSPFSRTPIGLPDYLANCDDKFPDYNSANGEGNPTILGLKIGTTYRNIEAGSNLSISIDWWGGQDPSNTSPASLPRLTLQGYMEKPPTPTPPPSSHSELESCFLAAHPDAKYWLPDRDNAVHDGFWARMIVQEGYWIGGFGDVARIGWINMTEWKGIREDGSAEGVGDGSGRGWGDVRLPGKEGD